jgi:hypothetical protein
MKRIFSVLALVLSVGCAHRGTGGSPPTTRAPDPTADIVARADSMVTAGSTAAALPHYRQAYANGMRDANVLYDAACAATLSGQRREAFTWLGRAIEAGFSDADRLTADRELAPLRSSTTFTQIIQSARRNQEQKVAAEPAANPDLQRELLQMATEARDARRAWMQAGSKRDRSLLLRVMHAGAKHATRMKEILSTYGWPGKRLVGQTASDGAAVLVQQFHRDLALQKQALPLLEQAVARKDASPLHLTELSKRITAAVNPPARSLSASAVAKSR